MSRAITIGNGNLLVGMDHRGQVRDFYFPHAGHADHVSGASGSYTHRIGVWVDGDLRWLNHHSWEVTIVPSSEGTLSVISAVNHDLNIRLTITDAVHNERNVFIRQLLVKNEHPTTRDVHVFFGQEFRIAESRRGDTALYDPRVSSVIHYKGHEAFLIHAMREGKSFTEYSVGLFGIEGREGTYTDAEDGELAKNAIEHGSVDSVIGLTGIIESHGESEIYYWIAAADSIKNAHALHAYVLRESPRNLLVSTERYWRAWVDKESPDLSQIDRDLQALYHRSLIIMRAHTDNGGGIIASSDSDMLNQGRDNYSYVWPRDASMTAFAFDRAKYFDTTTRYFAFIARLLEPDGYLMHKYRVDGVLGSSWHPWVRNGQTELPIQEDETATTIFMLARHYERAKDVEFIESLYNPFIEPAADFMCRYIDSETGLPKGSYDLWEEKYGTSTYTAASVYGALIAASDLSALLGKRENAERYRRIAGGIRAGILGYLYDAKLDMFVKLVHTGGERLLYDKTLDMSSFYGLFRFGVLPSSDERMKRALKVVTEKLKVQSPFGGYMRYEGDNYYRTGHSAPPNAWCITTLWVAQYLIQAAVKCDDLKAAYELMRQVYERASATGVLPEQVHPFTGEHTSAAPLVWSHAEFVITMHDYSEKFKALQS